MGTIYDNDTVDFRQQQFQKLLAEKKQPEIFDLTVGDTMDDLRDSALQTLETRMDDAQEQHEQEIERITERVSQQHLNDLRQRAKRARELEEAEFQSIVNSEPDDLPPLEPLMTEEEAIRRTQGAQRGLMEREKEQRRQTMEDAEVSSTLPPSRSKKTSETIDYRTTISKWRNTSEQDILYQLHLRGIELTEEEQETYNTAQGKGKQSRRSGSYDLTKKQFLVAKVEDLIKSGQWTRRINDELLRKRMEDWRKLKGKGRVTKD